MKPLKLFCAVAGFVVVVILVILAASKIAGHYLDAQDASNITSTVTCRQLGVSHSVTIKNNQASPVHTYGKLCDTMTITNEDNRLRVMAFGPHDNHQPYDGITEKVIGRGQSLQVTFNKTGTYHFHDHIDDVVTGDFTVTK